MGDWLFKWGLRIVLTSIVVYLFAGAYGFWHSVNGVLSEPYVMAGSFFVGGFGGMAMAAGWALNFAQEEQRRASRRRR